MSLPYFLSPDPASGVLDGAEGRHAVTVKRIAPGETIALTNGAGTVATVVVGEVRGKDYLSGAVVGVDTIPPAHPRVTLVQAIPKSERAELAVDLAVQGGADEIIPWISARTIARWPANKQAKQVEKWQATAREAAKQSRRAWVPQVAEPVTTNQLRALISGRQALALHEEATVPIRQVSFAEDVVVLVGPEGGIAPEELDALGAQPVKLGPEVLRTASAGFAALCAIGALTVRW
ncbi:16S rRNA (uracil(1498)-N(3))-methyltransferase [Corynebacterium liangguodongii]|uniref:Ribosomal RNA small subunit methyltransferase E n=1 Tax=Corynebacterium liangguodongii TaxID=2079535 RepID=A0A2S0WFC1_9CORY|nr:16S rRNA (uracil(1498)-N(3))-methyltransferase [Corynebacterium liangguodongii]AWB84468.1 16S rRNA (uracil(1498)-N(3))-methyltransferase [Corynebacterium liangguodongii]PWB98601.1 16S rRNA (uracil(1498)-N(3))-methyltransferase [Corynebacterium liangguodongii]